MMKRSSGSLQQQEGEELKQQGSDQNVEMKHYMIEDESILIQQIN